MSLERLAVTETSVVYTTKGGEQHTYDPLDFLALLCSHVPRPYESLTRFYGVYSSRVRGEQKKAEQRRQEETGQGSVAPEEEAPTKASSSWAACIKRVYEINPLESVSRRTYKFRKSDLGSARAETGARSVKQRCGLSRLLPMKKPWLGL